MKISIKYVLLFQLIHLTTIYGQVSKIVSSIRRNQNSSRHLSIYIKPVNDITDYEIINWSFAFTAPKNFHLKIDSTQSILGSITILSYPFVSSDGTELEYLVLKSNNTNQWDITAEIETKLIDIFLNIDACESSINPITSKDLIPIEYSYYVKNYIELHYGYVFLNIYDDNYYGKVLPCNQSYLLEADINGAQKTNYNYKVYINQIFQYKNKFTSGMLLPQNNNITLIDTLSYGQELLNISAPNNWSCYSYSSPVIIRCQSINFPLQLTQEITITVKARGIQTFFHQFHCESNNIKTSSNKNILFISSIYPDPCGSAINYVPIELFRNEEGKVDAFSYYDTTGIPLSPFVKSKFYLIGTRPAWSNNVHVTYQSGSVIELKPGFQTKLLTPNSSFELKIIPCE